MSKIKIWTNNPELLTIPECLPQPAHKFLPDWWKSTPLHEPDFGEIKNNIAGNKTIRKCPALHEYFSQGIIIPMWTDVVLKADGKTWGWNTPNDKYTWDIHSKEQFLNHSPSWVSEQISAVFKANCPWFIKTEPGYSVYQLPLFYHFNENYTVFPGTIQTDEHHEINQQLMFHSKEKEILIERGTPFVLYIPYKREQFKMEVVIAGKEENMDLTKSLGAINTKFTGGYKYHTDKICPVKHG